MTQVDVKSTLRGNTHAALLARAARASLKGRIRRASVSIILVGDARMRRLNRETLGHDNTTDVLSFDHGGSPEGRMIELVICVPEARRQGARLGIPFKEELTRYVVHGCLHCVGFSDAEAHARKRMWEQQERVLSRLKSPSRR